MGIRTVERMYAMCDDLVAEAARLVEPHDDGEVRAFAERLRGFEGLRIDELRERLKAVEIPGDFRHLRLTNLSAGMPWGGRYCMQQSRLQLDQILCILVCVVFRDDVTPQGRGVWTHTVALPVRDPGVLEQGLTFRSLH